MALSGVTMSGTDKRLRSRVGKAAGGQSRLSRRAAEGLTDQWEGLVSTAVAGVCASLAGKSPAEGGDPVTAEDLDELQGILTADIGPKESEEQFGQLVDWTSGHLAERIRDGLLAWAAANLADQVSEDVIQWVVAQLTERLLGEYAAQKLLEGLVQYAGGPHVFVAIKLILVAKRLGLLDKAWDSFKSAMPDGQQRADLAEQWTEFASDFVQAATGRVRITTGGAGRLARELKNRLTGADSDEALLELAAAIAETPIFTEESLRAELSGVVSKATVRRVLVRLVGDGIVERVPRAGKSDLFVVEELVD